MRLAFFRVTQAVAGASACGLAACALLVGDPDGHRTFDAASIDGMDAGDTGPGESDDAFDAAEAEAGDADVRGDGAVVVDTTDASDADAGPPSDVTPVASPFASQAIVLSAGESRPMGLAVTSSALYWANDGNVSIRSLARLTDGSFPAALADGGSPATTLASLGGAAQHATDLVFANSTLSVMTPGTSADFVYVEVSTGGTVTARYPTAACAPTAISTDGNTVFLGARMAGSTPMGASCPTTVIPGVIVHPLLSASTWTNVAPANGGLPQAVAGSADWVFFASPNTTGTNHSAIISQVPAPGSTNTGVSWYGYGGTVNDMLYDANGGVLYWCDNEGYILSHAIGTDVWVNVVAKHTTAASRLAFDGQYIYFTVQGLSGQGSIWMVVPTGGVPVLLQSMQGTPWAIAVDTKGLYWTNRDSNTVMMLPRSP